MAPMQVEEQDSGLLDVTRENFHEMLPQVEQALADCEFFAFDCEMTGLFLDGHRHEYLDDIQDR
jgi:poly(A)-specific ribonuclease